jgi:hypothetical protein
MGVVQDKERQLDEALALFGVTSKYRARFLQQARATVRAQEVEEELLKLGATPPYPTKNLIRRYDQRHKFPELAELDIIEFIQVVWGPWMRSRALSRAKLRELDPSADVAIQNWLNRKPRRKLPPEICLPTKKQINDEALARDPDAAFKSPELANVLAARLRRARRKPAREP